MNAKRMVNIVIEYDVYHSFLRINFILQDTKVS